MQENLASSSFARDRLLDFYRNEMFVDCSFKIGNQYVRAHKLILACSSPVFEKLFFGDMPSCDVHLTDFNVIDFKQAIDFIYTGDLELTSVDHAWELFHIADKYLVEDLGRICLEYIRKNIALSSLVLSYEYADMFGLDDIKQRCFKDMIVNQNALFQGYHMKPSTLRDLLEHNNCLLEDNLPILIVNLFTWAVRECELKGLPILPRNVLDLLRNENILRYIRNYWVRKSQCHCCRNFISECETLDSTIKESLSYACSVSPWEEKPVTVLTHIPKIMASDLLGVIFRQNLKIARRLNLRKFDAFVSHVTCYDSSVLLRGLYLKTEMNGLGSTEDFYEGTITVMVRSGDKLAHESKLATVVTNHFQYFSECYIPLKDVVILEREKLYELRISYCNFSTDSSNVICNYMSNKLFMNEDEEVAVTFFEDFGTVITGLSFYPA